MSPREIAPIVALLFWWPSVGLADASLQARCEKSIKDAASLPSVKIEFLETMWDPRTPARDPGYEQPDATRTSQFTYLQSGIKFHATRKLISAPNPNLIKFNESAFDGRGFEHDRDGCLDKGNESSNIPDPAETPFNPLSSPFLFLPGGFNQGGMVVERLSDVIASGWTNVLSGPVTEQPGGLLEISLPGLPAYIPPGIPNHEPPSLWKIEVDKSGAGFEPKAIEHIFPGHEVEVITRFFDYTNLGAYHFPARIEYVECAYPPTSPPTLISTGLVTLISAQIPNQIADSEFALANEEQSAISIWDRDRKAFTDPVHEAAKQYAAAHPLPKIYDESAAGAKQIADALVIAKREKKRVLLQFGANFCGPCHVLHQLFETDQGIADLLKRNYVVVMIDMDKGNNPDIDAKYGHPTRFGLSAIVVLDADGSQLTTQDTGKLEEDGRDSPKKIVAFLNQWI